MFFYRITANTPFCGTEYVYHIASKERIEKSEFAEYEEQYANENGQDFDYLVTGWDDENFDSEEERDEALENYYAECEAHMEEITKEEYEEEMGIGAN
jgi:hypothetical protein